MSQNRLIGSIRVQPEEARIFEPIKVDVLSPNGGLYGNGEPFEISINGVRGSSKYLQFRSIGEKRIRVTASSEGVQPEAMEARVNVIDGGGNSARAAHALLQAQPALADPTRLRIWLPDYQDFGTQILATTLPRPIENLTLAGIATQRTPAPKFGAIKGGARKGKASKAALLSRTAPSGISFRWDFGDGTTLETAGAGVEHDYWTSLSPEQEYAHFNVTAEVVLQGRVLATALRTITLHNTYAYLRARGRVYPRVEHDRVATLLKDEVYARISVVNREQFDLQLTKQRILLMDGDPDGSGTWIDADPVALTVPARANAAIEFRLARSLIPPASTTAIAYYQGNAGDNLEVRLSAAFDLPPGASTMTWQRPPQYARRRTWPWEVVTDTATIAALESLVRDGLVPPKSGISAATITRLAEAGKVDAAKFGFLGNGSGRRIGDLQGGRGRVPEGAEIVTLSGPGPFVPGPPPIGRETEDVVEGERCNPDNLPDSVPFGFACQLTEETEWQWVPARIVNARKGDILLNQGGPGELIGGILRHVQPSQRYSHSGIMTSNFEEVTHSTASIPWVLDHPNGTYWGEVGAVDGLQPNAVKYMWPGTATQTVQGAVYGEAWIGPGQEDLPEDQRKRYPVQGFYKDPVEGDFFGIWEAVPPLVVKPDPMHETVAIRNDLRRVAAYARSQAGRSHYRLYCYTDPTLAEIAPADAGWAAGTYPSVCSSFIWLCLRHEGIRLEAPAEPVTQADLEATDRALLGAEVGPTTKDGLYHYTAEERRGACEWLHETLKEMAWQHLEDEVGALALPVEWRTDATDDIANQIVNSFALDWSDTAAKDSERWRTTGESDAVSPDDTMKWDSPVLGGHYGVAEPLLYQPQEYRQVPVYRWKRVVQFGSLEGVVLLNDLPAPGAYVELYEGKSFPATGPDGRFVLEDIPVGDHTIKASKAVGGMNYSASQRVHVSEGRSEVTLILQPPPETHRAVRIEASIRLFDSEQWPSPDEVSPWTDYVRNGTVNPAESRWEVPLIEQRCGGEVRGELRLWVDLLIDLSLGVRWEAILFEGTTEETTDREASGWGQVIVPKGGSADVEEITIENNTLFGDDNMKFRFTVHNDQGPA